MKKKVLLCCVIAMLTQISNINAQSYDVGTLPGVSNVSPSGAFTFTIPIDLPPGRAGMEPALALAYNSQAPSNIMGVGWGLSGFSSIGRLNPTLYYNGEVDNVDFENDQLMMDGNKIIEVGRENGNIIYRTEMDDFSKIVYHTDGLYGDYFVVFSKNGLIKEYGNSSDSRQYYSGCSNPDDSPLFWHLNKIFDRQNNSVHYYYQQSPAKGSLHPHKIEYTHYEERSESGFSYTVAFKYDSLPNIAMKQIFYFEKDGEVYKNINFNRLDQIDIYYKNDERKVIKTYSLSYNSNTSIAGEYFLEAVSLTNYNITTGKYASFKSTTFDWNFYKPKRIKNPVDFKDFVADPFFDSHYYVISSLDINGDGKSEVVDYKESFDSIAGDPIRMVTIYTFGARDTISIIGNINSRVKSLSAADFDNDGSDELIVVMADIVQIYNFQQTGNKWSAELLFSYSKTGAYLKALPGDYTGDGLVDLLIVDEIAGEALLNIGSGHEPEYFEDITYTFSDFNPNDQLEEINSVADFNGDGKTDIALEKRTNILNSSGKVIEINYLIEIHCFTGSDFELLPGSLSFVNDSAAEKEDNIYYVDLNGDGRCDIHHQIVPKQNVYGKESNTSYHSFGKGFKKNPELSTDHDENTPSLYLSDMNNDGRADWVYLELGIDPVAYKGQFIKTNTFFAHPNGLSVHAVVQKTYITNEYNYAGSIAGLTIADLTGNGINDIALGFIQEMEDEQMLKPYEYQLYAINDIAEPAANVISTITNGMGVERSITYQTSQKAFTGFNDLAYPVGPYKAKVWYVDETFISDDKGNKLDHFQYHFTTPMVMLRGKGFIGFKTTDVSSYDSYTRSITNYKLHIEDVDGKEFCFVQYPETTIINTLDDPPIKLMQNEQKMDIKYSIAENYLVQLPVITQSIEKFWDNDENHTFIKTVKSVQNINKIDQYGNSLESKVLFDEGKPSSDETYEYEVLISRTFAEYIDLNNWLVGRPVSITKTLNKAGEADDVFTTHFQYIINSLLVEHKSVTPNNNDLLKYYVHYEYDNFGNLVKQTLDPGKFEFNGQSLEERITEYEYNFDANHVGRFLTSSVNSVNGTTFKTRYSYDFVTGSTKQIKTPDLLESNFYFNVSGRLTTTTNDLGAVNHQYTLWNNDHRFAPTHMKASYYLYTYVEGAETHKIYTETFRFYDKFGRLLREVSLSLDSNPIFVDYHYDHKGRVSKVSEPYFSEDQAFRYTNYDYDNLSRVFKIISAKGTIINYFYNGRSTSSLNLGTNVTTKKVLNALGNIKSITDPSGNIDYQYYSSGKLKKIDALGAVTQLTYDDAGRQKTMTEPNTGQQNYIYNPFGELMQQTDFRGNTYEVYYDNLGRVIEKKLVNTGESTQYRYNDINPTSENKGNGFGMLERVFGANDFSYHYFYDEFNRIETQLEIHPGNENGVLEYIGRYTYDNDLGRLGSYTYPTGFQISYNYATNGMLKRVSNDENGEMLWENNSMNARGQITEYDLGNGLTTNKSFDDYGYPSVIKTGNIQHLGFKFNYATGNLEQRSDSLLDLAENFSYDYLLNTRLATWKVEGQKQYFSWFAENGNLIFKSDVTNLYKKKGIPGEFIYGVNAGPHAVTSITNPTTEYEDIAFQPEYISYTPFNKVDNIKHFDKGTVKELDFSYGPYEARKITKLYDTPESRKRTLIKTKYFVMNNFEIEIDRFGNERKLHYLMGGDGLFAIYVEAGKHKEMYYVHKDYLGSYYCITDEDGEIAKYEGEDQIYSFDPWGRRRNHQTWTYDNVPGKFLFDRGFTGHEHLDRFDLINMNGRVYDSWLGRFLSADPFVQTPTYSQNFNRYTYAFNNPLRFVDRNGYTNGPPHDFNGRNGFAGMNGSPFSVGPRGQINFSNFTKFGNSGFSMATRETRAVLVGTDEEGKPIYEFQQVLVYKDKTGNIIDEHSKKTKEINLYKGTVYYVIKKNGGIIIFGVDNPNGDSWFVKQALGEGDQVKALILTSDVAASSGGDALDFQSLSDVQKIILLMDAIRDSRISGGENIDVRQIFSNYPKHGGGVDIIGNIKIGDNSMTVYMNMAIYQNMQIDIYPARQGQVGPFNSINVNGISKEGYWDMIELNRTGGNLPMLMIQVNTNFDVFYNYLYK